MNKIIPSEDRVFMSMVGPAASGESHLIFLKKLKKELTNSQKTSENERRAKNENPEPLSLDVFITRRLEC